MEKHRVVLGDKAFVTYRSQADLAKDVEALAIRLNEDLPHFTRPLALCVLNGAFVFAADILRAIDIDIPLEFVRYSSYVGTTSTGKTRELIGLTENVEGRDILIIEDIVDSGNTMKSMLKYLSELGAKSVHIVAMFLKPEVFKGEFQVKYVAHNLPNLFVIGYGLDYNGMGRTLKDLYILEA